MKMRIRKALIILAAVILSAGCLSGCTPGDTTTVAKVGDSSIPYGVANFYARFNQSTYEMYYAMMGYAEGVDWNMNVGEDETLEESTKGDILKNLEALYILEDHMEEYGVTVTDAERQKMEEAADAFLAANSEKDCKKISATKENIVRVMELMTIQNKMNKAMIADVDTEVSDEEAAQKKMYYVEFPFESNVMEASDVTSAVSDLTSAVEGDEESGKAADADEAKKQAEDFLASVKDSSVTGDEFSDFATDSGYTARELTFDGDDESPSVDVITAADALKEGESTVVTGVNTVYAVYLASEFDEAATESQKSTLASQRQQDAYDELYNSWLEATDISVKEGVWKKISFADLGIQAPAAEESAEDQAAEVPVEETTEDQDAEVPVEEAAEDQDASDE